MASVAARLTVIGENGYGEPEQDANSALTELDKGLRSGKIGDQCEAIVRFPRLFEKYPFPILINSAFLKLADVFRIDNNFLRLCILKVTQQSEKHLDKILNVDEFVRRIFTVIHSNDPTARALTLRTLGSIACIIPEWKNVHHSIRIGLDSHDSVELQAAIFAVQKFAAQSRIFAANICSKIGQMIEGLSTPINVKLESIAILQNMHHDAEIIIIVRKLCTSLLPEYPTQEFVVIILKTLTRLSASSLLFVEDQVELLEEYMHSDLRTIVKISVLKNLKVLALGCAQFWKRQHIDSVCNFAKESPYSELKYEALDVLAILAQSTAVAKFDVSPNSIYQSLCDEACYDDNLLTSSKAVELLTHLAVHTYRESPADETITIYEEAVVAVESLLLAVTSTTHSPKRTKALKLALKCAILLSETKSDVGQEFVNSIGTLITTTTDKNIFLLCEALAAIANKKPGVLKLLLPDLLQHLQEMHAVVKQERSEAKTLVVMIVLLFQGLMKYPSDEQADNVMKNVICTLDLWDCYKVARQGARYGHHRMAADIFSNLSNRVCSEHFHFWLVALSEFCLGESCLQPRAANISKVQCISNATVHYMKGISALKAATTPTNLLHFQCEYVRLRSEVLQVHAQLIWTCTSLKTSPPPAISAAVAAATRDELQRCGRITAQLRKCVREFRSLGDQYGRLYQSVFDADPVTLINLQLLQQNCFLVAHAIDTIALRVQNLGSLEEEPLLELTLGTFKKQAKHTLETLGIVTAAQEASALVSGFTHNDPLRLIGNQHVNELLQISGLIVDVPLCFPRYFFQSLQATSIKLAISPQPRSPGEPVNIQSNSHLALKVEGVIQHGAKQGLFRRVHRIILNISSAVQNRAQMNADVKMPNDNTNTMTQTVEPHNDYFNAQFLLAFPVAGIHVIVVEVSVLDEQENMWKTGPRSSLTIKSFEDMSNPKQMQSSSGSRWF